jgi:hypothetical protein
MQAHRHCPEGAPADALQAFVVPDTRGAIEKAVEAFIARLDEMDGDPELEDSEASETAIDEKGRYLDEREIGFGADGRPCTWVRTEDNEHAATEWHTRGRHKEPGPSQMPGAYADEDSEDDDPDHGGDEAEPDFRRPPPGYGPGCEIADSDFCLAGDDRVRSGPVMGGGGYEVPMSGEAIGSEDDAEEGGDTELNGDEGDYGGEVDGI